MASRLVLQQLGRRTAMRSTATVSGSGVSAAAARAFSSGSTNGTTVASSNAQGLGGHYTGARPSSQFREIAKLKKSVNDMDTALSYIGRRLSLAADARHQEAAANSRQVLDALGLGSFYGFLGGFMLHYVISKL